MRIPDLHRLQLRPIVEPERDWATRFLKYFCDSGRATDDAPGGVGPRSELARKDFYSHTARHYAIPPCGIAKLFCPCECQRLQRGQSGRRGARTSAE